VLLTVLALPLIGAGLIFLVVGPQLFGVLLLVIAAVALLWLWLSKPGAAPDNEEQEAVGPHEQPDA
jgi:hypothetical protein